MLIDKKLAEDIDLEEIAKAVDCTFERNFVLKNGDKV